MQDTTTTITKADLNERNEYSASADLSVVGHLRFAANLGRVRILGALSATLSITAEAGSGIEAGLGIEAGSGIKAGWGIEAGEGIEAGWGIKAGLMIICGVAPSKTISPLKESPCKPSPKGRS